MDIPLPEKEKVREVLSKLNQELHSDRVDRYEIERTLNKLNSLEQDIVTRSHNVLPRNRGILIPLMHTIQDDLYKLRGSAWRSVYLANKRNRMDEETLRLKKELYTVEKDSENLVSHVNDVDRLIKELTPKETAAIGAAIVLIAMSGFLFSSFQSFKIFAQPYTGLSILPSVRLVAYFVFATLLVLAMFAFLFSIKKK